MADRGGAGQPVDHLAPRKDVADEAEPALEMEARAVERDDAGRLLAAVLQGVQAERRDGRGVGMAENAEDAAFLAQPVAVKVEEGRFGHGQSALRSALASPANGRVRCPVLLIRRRLLRLAALFALIALVLEI